MFTVFTCNDMEAAWIESICAQGEREMEQWERDEDRDHEEMLAREAVENGETEAWPEYADAPLEIAEPEVIDDADLFGFAVAGGSDDVDDWDDELDVESLDDDIEAA